MCTAHLSSSPSVRRWHISQAHAPDDLRLPLAGRSSMAAQHKRDRKTMRRNLLGQWREPHDVTLLHDLGLARGPLPAGRSWLASIRDHWGGAAHVITTGPLPEVNHFIRSFPEELMMWGSREQMDWDSDKLTSKVSSPKIGPISITFTAFSSLCAQSAKSPKLWCCAGLITTHTISRQIAAAKRKMARAGIAWVFSCTGNGHITRRQLPHGIYG